jgi:hypothetical protein
MSQGESKVEREKKASTDAKTADAVEKLTKLESRAKTNQTLPIKSHHCLIHPTQNHIVRSFTSKTPRFLRVLLIQLITKIKLVGFPTSKVCPPLHQKTTNFQSMVLKHPKLIFVIAIGA